MRLNKLQQTAVTALEDIKARDITVLDVRKLTSIYDSMIIASAESNRQVKALAHHVRDKLKEAGATIIGVEGEAVRRMGARRLRRHRRACHAARSPRLLQPRGALAGRRLDAPRESRGMQSPARATIRAAVVERPRAKSVVKLRIVALGHRMPAWVAAGYAEYAKRLPREYAAGTRRAEAGGARRRQGRCAAACGRSAAHSRGVRRMSRWSRSTSAAPHGPRASWRSGSRDWRDAAQDVAFVIGSADGLDDVGEARRRRRLRTVGADAAARPRPDHASGTALSCRQRSRGHPYHRD